MLRIKVIRNLCEHMKSRKAKQDIIKCPECEGTLKRIDHEIVCIACGLVYAEDTKKDNVDDEDNKDAIVCDALFWEFDNKEGF